MLAGVVIGPATDLDAGELLTVQRAAYVTEAQRYRDCFLPPLTQTLGELRRDIVESTVLKAVSGTRLIGSVRARPDGAVWRIGRLVVVPDLQGRGLGSRLLTAIEELAPPCTREYALFTGASSGANVRLYQRCGYRVERHQAQPVGSGLVHLSKPAAG